MSTSVPRTLWQKSYSTSTFTLGQAIRLSRRQVYKSILTPESPSRSTFEASTSCSIPTANGASTRPHRRHYTQLRDHSTASLLAAPAPPEQSSGLEDTKRQAAYDRLRPVIDSFKGPVDWAVAYGSGVIHQANRPASGEAPLTDFMLSTPSAFDFHRANIRQNPSHYPISARMLGATGVSWLQENWGAGVWYVTMVKVNGLDVKYGIISTPALAKDLAQWTTLYISGRLHKPHLPLVTNPSLTEALRNNLRSALTLALILLPERFTEMQLWEKIAGLSYAGDPRMSVPGAENPEKVKNIVRGEGVLEGFREMYGGLMGEFEGLRWAEQPGQAYRPASEKHGNGNRWSWMGEGEYELMQPPTPDHLATLLLTLPKSLLHPIARHYRPTIVGSLVSPEVKMQRAEDKTPRREVPNERDFWVRVAGEERIREVVLNELRHVIRRPALTQSIKGLFTAGFVKSFYYSLAKFRKWWKARQQRRARR